MTLTCESERQKIHQTCDAGRRGRADGEWQEMLASGPFGLEVTLGFAGALGAGALGCFTTLPPSRHFAFLGADLAAGRSTR